MVPQEFALLTGNTFLVHSFQVFLPQHSSLWMNSANLQASVWKSAGFQ
jgi:hypothetical protein